MGRRSRGLAECWSAGMAGVVKAAAAAAAEAEAAAAAGVVAEVVGAEVADCA